MKVDHTKELNEKLLEQAVEVLSHTIPEQKIDAMKDYHKVIRTLERGNDWRFKPIIAKLQMLYMYPGRKLHNSMVVELHELLEEVREKRINQMIENQRKKDLGDLPTVGVVLGLPAWLKLSMIAIGLYVVFGRK